MVSLDLCFNTTQAYNQPSEARHAALDLAGWQGRPVMVARAAKGVLLLDLARLLIRFCALLLMRCMVDV
jgi:hypothetical protein